MSNSQYSELIADVKEQVLYLQELGVKALAVEMPAASLKSKVQSPTSVEAVVEPKSVIPNPKSDISKSKPRSSRLASLPSLAKREPIHSMGEPEEPDVPETPIIPDVPVEPEPVKIPDTPAIPDVPTTPAIPEIPVIPEPSPVPEIAISNIETIQSIRAEIGNCTRCKLHSLGRTQIVHTTGNFNADLMFVGEAPGADEDLQGFPFVGRAGQLLTKIIESIGMNREDVCIGNINRCRPPGNRQPEPDETAQCRPFILREIAVVRPKVIVVLGATAAHNLLQVRTPISKLRGNFQDYFGVKVMPTFHPAYLLRDPHKKREVWDDMKMVRDYLQRDES